MLNDFPKIREEGSALKKDLRERTSGYVVAALSLVAGLAWNDAVKSLIEFLFPLAQNSLTAKFLYAALVTLIVGVVSFYLLRIVGKSDR